jgi:hypothetical protein
MHFDLPCISKKIQEVNPWSRQAMPRQVACPPMRQPQGRFAEIPKPMYNPDVKKIDIGLESPMNNIGSAKMMNMDNRNYNVSPPNPALHATYTTTKPSRYGHIAGGMGPENPAFNLQSVAEAQHATQYANPSGYGYMPPKQMNTQGGQYCCSPTSAGPSGIGNRR